MRPSLLLVGLSLTLSAQASWFGGASSDEPAYSSWSTTELRQWLEQHKVDLPSHTPTQAELRDLVAANWNAAAAWTQEQYANAQKSFADVRDSSFDAWDESRLREFLLEQGVVAPKGPREQLVLLAKSRYKAYTDAASSLSSRASATASTAVYGDTKHQMSKSAASIASQATAAAAQATRDAARTFDESKDYVYSTWDDNQLRSYLENKGVIKTKSQKKRDELIALMHDAYGRVTNPVWDAWSDSYIHHWLVSHNVIKSDAQKNREKLRAQMNKYYYSTTDSVWNTWTDSQLKQWLVERGYVRSDAQVKRDKMLKLVEDNYVNARDTFWSAWSDNQIRDWLIEHGYMRSDAQVKRDELIKSVNDRWTDANAKTAAYLTWPDARLRAYLREHGVSEELVPGDRPGLLQETRIRWVQTQTRAEALFSKIRDIVNGGVFQIEEALHKLTSLLAGGWEETKEKGHETKVKGEKGYEQAKVKGEKGYYEAKAKGEKGWKDSRENVGEKVKAGGDKVKTGGEKIKGEL
ncbi:hypothetical protein BDQ12DRAFT_632360 [Crucibulum laeve]|uniref:Stress response protein ish1 n=1 Tax=Crucibulum laeve TaxID=68775 RepID=A0A5C3LXQ8_9AGAR|nr:hypothetical protein BDQ12DRAFT_632360 [Crucibulum laeve]